MTKVILTRREIAARRKSVTSYHSYADRRRSTLWNAHAGAKAAVQAHWDKFNRLRDECGLPVLCPRPTPQDIRRNAELRKVARKTYRLSNSWSRIQYRLGNAMMKFGKYPDGKLKNGKPVNFSVERRTVECYQALRAKMKKAKR